MIEKREFYIDGAWVAPKQPHDLAVINPSTEEPFAIISLGGQADTDAAVAAARRAFGQWSQSSHDSRLALVRRILEVYETRAEDMSQAISQEMGAPIDMARASQTTSGSWHINAFLEAFPHVEFERPLGPQAPDNLIVLEPIGVVAMITPWNWPMNQVALKVIPALLAGCTMVLKPSEIAPLSSIVFAEIMDQAGVPAGVFNMVNGDGVGVGTQLSVHPDVDMVSFTGSTRAGVLISKAAADTVKRVHLELGGKGANIVFADSDPGAVRRGVADCFGNTGQSCNAPTRMLVERKIYDRAVAEAAEQANATTVGPAHLSGNHLGPVVSQAQYDKIQSMIEAGIAEGARLIAGGLGRPDAMNRGFFVQPTVFADVSNDMTIAREEIFGPVLSMIPFDTEEEALAIANDTVYGLTNYVQTQDPAKAKRAARALRSGMVRINGRGLGAGHPFGGMKRSGSGREGGVWGIEDFCEIKAIAGWSDT